MKIKRLKHIVTLVTSLALVGGISSQAMAQCNDCASEQLNQFETRRQINQSVVKDFFQKLREEFLVGEFFDTLWDPAFQEKTAQATVLETQMLQTESTLRDAETTNAYALTNQKLMAEFAIDALPSPLYGSLITFSSGLSESTRASLVNTMRGTQISVDRALAGKGTREARGLSAVNAWRLEQLQDIYLDKVKGDDVISGRAKEPERVNRDVNVGETLFSRNTLDIDFSDNETTQDERDLLALKENLLPSSSMDFAVDADLRGIQGQVAMNDRMAIAAKRALIDRTFQAIAAGKSKGSAEAPQQLRQALINLGYAEDSEIVKEMSGKPSYEAHMAVLTRHFFSNPAIYADLVDNKANLQRIMIAQEAASLMQMVDMYHTVERGEGLLALWAWLEASKQQQELDARAK